MTTPLHRRCSKLTVSGQCANQPLPDSDRCAAHQDHIARRTAYLDQAAEEAARQGYTFDTDGNAVPDAEDRQPDEQDDEARRLAFWRSKMARADNEQGRYRDATVDPEGTGVDDSATPERIVTDADITSEAQLIDALGFVPTHATVEAVSADEPLSTAARLRAAVHADNQEVEAANQLYDDALTHIHQAAIHLARIDEAIDEDVRAEAIAEAHAHAALATAQLEARKALLS